MIRNSAAANEKVRCNLCGEEWRIEEGRDMEEVMARHMLFDHPLEFLSHEKVQRGIANFFESLGAQFADLLKGKYVRRKS